MSTYHAPADSTTKSLLSTDHRYWFLFLIAGNFCVALLVLVQPLGIFLQYCQFCVHFLDYTYQGLIRVPVSIYVVGWNWYPPCTSLGLSSDPAPPMARDRLFVLCLFTFWTGKPWFYHLHLIVPVPCSFHDVSIHRVLHRFLRDDSRKDPCSCFIGVVRA